MERKGPRLFFMARVYSSQFLMHSDPIIANFTTLTWARVETLGTAGDPTGRNLHRFVAVGQPQLGDASDGKEWKKRCSVQPWWNRHVQSEMYVCMYDVYIFV